jgi:hypothetical protein
LKVLQQALRKHCSLLSLATQGAPMGRKRGVLALAIAVAVLLMISSMAALAQRPSRPVPSAVGPHHGDHPHRPPKGRAPRKGHHGKKHTGEPHQAAAHDGDRAEEAVAAGDHGGAAECDGQPAAGSGYDALLLPGAHSAAPRAATACDPMTVPFDAATSDGCTAYLADRRNWAAVEIMAPKFEQRTIKYAVTLRDGTAAMMKVPQALFPTEPFSEVAAYQLDRFLDVRRVPPTVLVDVALADLVAAVERGGGAIPMVKEFGSSSKTFVEWVKKDFVTFVRRSKSPAFMRNATHVMVSLQLSIADVAPLLSSALKVPYSKAHPGWHRWFNPAWPGFAAIMTRHRPALLALSQMAMFDFFLGNSDRSPNKNNFVVLGCLGAGHKDGGGCHGKRGEGGRVMTFVHLDHGMAFNGFSHVHNPIAKKRNNTFCVYYAPLVRAVRCLVRRHPTAELLEAAFLARVPGSVATVMGEHRLSSAIRTLPLLVAKVDACIDKFGADVAVVEK